MNPRGVPLFDPMAEASPDPFSEIRTIPGGWDVSAFYAPERENLPHYRVMNRASRAKGVTSSPHVYSESGEE